MLDNISAGVCIATIALDRHDYPGDRWLHQVANVMSGIVIIEVLV